VALKPIVKALKYLEKAAEQIHQEQEVRRENSDGAVDGVKCGCN